MARHVGRWVLLLLIVPIGAIVGIVATGLVGTLGNRHLAVVSGAACGAALTAVAAVAASRRWEGRARAVARWGVPAATLALVAVVVVPLVYGSSGPYHEPAPAQDVGMWELPTGSSLAYVSHAPDGQRQQPPVVMLHGGPGSPGAFEPTPLVDRLVEDGFVVYQYHQVGAGLSSRLDDVEDYTVERHITDLDEVREKIGSDRLILIGQSWGAQLAANYTAEHPQRVARAVFAAPGPIWPGAYTDSDRLVEGVEEQQLAAAASHPRFLVANVLVGSGFASAAATLFPDERIDGTFQSFVLDLDMRAGCPNQEVRQPLQGVAGVGFWVNAMTTRDARRPPDRRDKLARVEVPALVVRGECDYLAPEVAREYTELLGDADFVAVDDAGHTPATDQPELFAELVADFVTAD